MDTYNLSWLKPGVGGRGLRKNTWWSERLEAGIKWVCYTEGLHYAENNIRWSDSPERTRPLARRYHLHCSCHCVNLSCWTWGRPGNKKKRRCCGSLALATKRTTHLSIVYRLSVCNYKFHISFLFYSLFHCLVFVFQKASIPVLSLPSIAIWLTAQPMVFQNSLGVLRLNVMVIPAVSSLCVLYCI